MTAGKTVKIITRRKFMEEAKKKRSNLVMPTHYQELTREEMEYVDGGVFIGIRMTSKQVQDFMAGLDFAVSIIDMVGISTVAPIIGKSLTTVCSPLIAAGPLGIAALAVIGAAATAIGVALFTSYAMGVGFECGVDISINWRFKIKAQFRCGWIG